MCTLLVFVLSILFSFPLSVYNVDSLVEKFFESFNRNYERALSTDFMTLNLQQQMAFVDLLFDVSSVMKLIILRASNQDGMHFLFSLAKFSQT